MAGVSPGWCIIWGEAITTHLFPVEHGGVHVHLVVGHDVGVRRCGEEPFSLPFGKGRCGSGHGVNSTTYLFTFAGKSSNVCGVDKVFGASLN